MGGGTATVDGNTWTWTLEDKWFGQAFKGRTTVTVKSASQFTSKYEYLDPNGTYVTIAEGTATRSRLRDLGRGFRSRKPGVHALEATRARLPDPDLASIRTRFSTPAARSDQGSRRAGARLFQVQPVRLPPAE
jgi:hypothetical protein